jgi:sialic acid synthase SpsE
MNKNKVSIIAEIGVNHEGNFSVAKKMIALAKRCGADAVKFQTFIPELYVSINDQKRFKRYKKFQLSFEEFKRLSVYAKKIKISFFSTPFDLKSAKFLNNIQKIYKISSGDSNFKPLLRTVAGFNKSIILSTGMTEPNIIAQSKKLIFDIWKKKKKNAKKLVIMHCVSSYPVEKEEANLLAINALKEKFKDCEIGYSDHTIGTSAALAAVALGAKVIEKHFTLSKSYSKFRDHKLSADPNEMRKLVNEVRDLEKILGNGEKKIQKSEKKTINYMRRSAVAAVEIPKGKKISDSDIKWIRIKNGLKINFEKRIIKRKAKKIIKKDKIILKKYLF